MKAAVVTHTRRLLLPALGAALLGGAGCGDMPEDDPGAMERVTLIALLEPGDSGLQEVKLTRPVDLGTAVNVERPGLLRRGGHAHRQPGRVGVHPQAPGPQPWL